jgi:hypothetical protein
MTDDDDAKRVTKFVLSMIKAVPSTLIDIDLSEQEKLAQKEQRFNDLRWIRSEKSIKKHVDSILDDLISSI